MIMNNYGFTVHRHRYPLPHPLTPLLWLLLWVYIPSLCTSPLWKLQQLLRTPVRHNAGLVSVIASPHLLPLSTHRLPPWHDGVAVHSRSACQSPLSPRAWGGGGGQQALLGESACR